MGAPLGNKYAVGNNGGRPTEYSIDMAITICDLTAQSNMSLKSICENIGIGMSSVFRWLLVQDEFRKMYAIAKEAQADYLAEEIIEIADDRSRDDTPFSGANHVQRARLQVDARKWIASKLKPRKYGDKVDITTDGEKVSVPVTYEIIKPVED